MAGRGELAELQMRNNHLQLHEHNSFQASDEGTLQLEFEPYSDGNRPTTAAKPISHAAIKATFPVTAMSRQNHGNFSTLDIDTSKDRILIKKTRQLRPMTNKAKY